MEISAVDLFCGAGGLTNGLEAAGLTVEAGFDIDEDCQYAYETNNDATFEEVDLAEVGQKNPGRVGEYLNFDADATLIAGCAPCQPFSPLNHGKNSSEHVKYGMLSVFAEIVEEIQPDFVVMENVYEVRKDPAYRDFVDRLRDVGYNINLDRDKRVFCPGYGIPQKRRRWVALASKRGSLNLGSPTRTDESEYVSVREAIGHLEPLQAGKTDPDDWLHTTRPLSETNLKRVRASVPGGTWRDWDEDLMLECHKNEKGSTFASVYGRMVPDEPAPTITTQFYNLGSGRFGHYDEEQDRALSLREGAILQTFPDEYAFAEEFEDLGMTKFGQMIGNAVPPDLGEVIGRRVRDFVAGVDRQQALSDYHDS